MKKRTTKLPKEAGRREGGGVGVGDKRSVRGLGVKVKGQGSCHRDTSKGEGVKMTLSLLTGVRVVKVLCYTK